MQPKERAEALKKALAAIKKHDIKNFLLIMESFSNESGDVPDLNSLSALHAFKVLGEQSVDKFFGALGALSNNLQLIISIAKLKNLTRFPAFNALGDPNIRNLFAAILELSSQSKDVIDIKDFPKCQAFKGLSDQNQNLLIAMSELLSANVIESASLAAHPAFDAIKTDWRMCSIFEKIWKLSIESKGLVHIKELEAESTIFKVLDDDIIESIKTFSGAIWDFVNEFFGNNLENVKKIENLSKFPNIQKLGGVKIFLEAMLELSINYKDLISAEDRESLSSTLSFKAIGGVGNFFTALYEFSGGFTNVMDMPPGQRSLGYFAYQPEDQCFLRGIIQIAGKLIEIENLKNDIGNIKNLTEIFLLWIQEITGQAYSVDDHSDMYLEKIIIAGSVVNLYLIKCYLKQQLGLEGELQQEIDKISGFSDLNKMINVFAEEHLFNFKNSHENFLRLQIAKNELSLLLCHSLRLQGLDVDGKDTQAIEFSITQLYACDDLSKFQVAIKNLNQFIKNICNQCSDKDKNNENLKDLVYIYHYKSLVKLGQEVQVTDPLLAQEYLELALLVAETDEEKQLADRFLKKIYAELNTPQKDTDNKKNSLRFGLKQVSNVLSGSRKSLRSVEISKETPANLLMQLQNVFSGNAYWNFEFGEIFLNRYVYLVVGVAGSQKFTDPLAKFLGDELFAAYLIRRENKALSNEIAQCLTIQKYLLDAFYGSDGDLREQIKVKLDQISNFINFLFNSAIGTYGFCLQELSNLIAAVKRFNEEHAHQYQGRLSRLRGSNVFQNPLKKWQGAAANKNLSQSWLFYQSAAIIPAKFTTENIKFIVKELSDAGLELERFNLGGFLQHVEAFLLYIKEIKSDINFIEARVIQDLLTQEEIEQLRQELSDQVKNRNFLEIIDYLASLISTCVGFSPYASRIIFCTQKFLGLLPSTQDTSVSKSFSYNDIVFADKILCIFLVQEYLKSNFKFNKEELEVIDAAKNLSHLVRLCKNFENCLYGFSQNYAPVISLFFEKSNIIPALLGAAWELKNYKDNKSIDELIIQITALYKEDRQTLDQATSEVKISLHNFYDSYYNKNDTRDLQLLAKCYYFDGLKKLAESVNHECKVTAKYWLQLAFINCSNKEEEKFILKEWQKIDKDAVLVDAGSVEYPRDLLTRQIELIALSADKNALTRVGELYVKRYLLSLDLPLIGENIPSGFKRVSVNFRNSLKLEPEDDLSQAFAKERQARDKKNLKDYKYHSDLEKAAGFLQAAYGCQEVSDVNSDLSKQLKMILKILHYQLHGSLKDYVEDNEKISFAANLSAEKRTYSWTNSDKRQNRVSQLQMGNRQKIFGRPRSTGSDSDQTQPPKFLGSAKEVSSLFLDDSKKEEGAENKSFQKH